MCKTRKITGGLSLFFSSIYQAHRNNAAKLLQINLTQTLNFIVIFTLFLLIINTNNQVLAGKLDSTIKTVIKAITLIEKSHTLVHAEFSIQMEPNQLSYRIDELPLGIISESIKIVAVDKDGPQIIQQTLIKKSFDPTYLQQHPLLKPKRNRDHQLQGSQIEPTRDRQSPSLEIKFAQVSKEKQQFLLSYQITTVTWGSDIDLKIDQNRVDLSNWVSISNVSQTDFENIRVTLIEITAPPEKQNRQDLAAMGDMIARRLYQNQTMPDWVKVYAHKLPSTVSIPSLSQSKVLLYHYTDIPIKFQLIYEGMIRDQQYFSQKTRYQRSNQAFNQRSQQKVWQVMEVLLQSKKQILHPLPSSKLRLYDADNILMSTQYLPRIQPGKTLEIMIKPEDVLSAKRRQVAFDVIERDKVVEETYKIDLKNPAKQAYTIVVREYLDRSSVVKMIDSTHEHKIQDNILNYLVEIKPESTMSLTYTVRYTW